MTLAPDVVVQVIGEDALLLDLTHEVVFALNTTGARIAELADGTRDVRDVIATLAREYGVPSEVIAPDVLTLVEELARRGFLVVGSELT